MIYDEYWSKDISRNWIKIDVPQLGKPLTTPASSKVAFYATTQAAYEEVHTLFERTLPAGVVFDEAAR